MASVRSSLPSRLRQLLSSEGAIGPSVKLDSEPVLFLLVSLPSFMNTCMYAFMYECSFQLTFVL